MLLRVCAWLVSWSDPLVLRGSWTVQAAAEGTDFSGRILEQALLYLDRITS
jgi:hypothetical protein